MQSIERDLPLVVRQLICRYTKHRRGVLVHDSHVPAHFRVFRCPRCERRTRYAKPEPVAS
jgi:hypothetical protein